MRKLVHQLKNGAAAFKSSEHGNFTMITGILAPVIFLSAFMALDYTNASRIGTQMATSLDAAVLAAATEATTLDSNLTDEEATAVLKDYIHTYFNANFDNLMGAGDQSIPKDDFNFTYDRDAGTLSVSVKYDYDTAGLRFFNHEIIEVNKVAATKLAVVAEHYVIDIVMCLDATGSMQATLDAVKAQATSFSDDLLAELGSSSDYIKVRVKPIFYRDWEDHVNEHNLTRYHSWSWYVPYYWNYYKNYYGSYYEGGLIESDFIDLHPSAESGLSSSAQDTAFRDFVGSEKAVGGWNWPEAAGACLNEGIRSDWFDVTSQESHDFFDIPDDQTIIQDGETPPTTGAYSKVSLIPVVVTWSDATINSLSLSRTYISSTTPTSYSAFENLWKNGTYINQDRKIMIRFGPQSASGWNTIKNWEDYHWGGNLATGNEDGVKKIAEIIKKTVPDVLRLTN